MNISHISRKVIDTKGEKVILPSIYLQRIKIYLFTKFMIHGIIIYFGKLLHVWDI